MASEGKSAGAGSGGSKLKMRLSVDIPKSEVTRLYPAEVRAIVDAAAGGKDDDDGDVVIIDTRTVDYEGGHIPGSVHIEFDPETQDDELTKLVSKYASKKQVIFVCLYGEQRSPSIATSFAAKRTSMLSEGEGPEVCVLLGGVFKYAREFWEERESALEGFDADVWVPEEGTERFVHRSSLE